MTFTLMAGIFTMFCTNALGIDPVLLGTLVIIWTVWDAINDPLMGALMDKAFAKKQDPRGKFRPWLLRATPLLAVCILKRFNIQLLLLWFQYCKCALSNNHIYRVLAAED